jgi:uncharacterized protein (TIGR00255 family)
LFAEPLIKSYLQKNISRGKVDVYLGLDPVQNNQPELHLNEQLAESYREMILSIAKLLDLPSEISALDIARFPDVMSVNKDEPDQEVFEKEMLSLLELAVSDYNAMRCREGEALYNDLLEKTERIEAMVDEIDQRAAQTLSAYRDRLNRKLQEVLSDTSIAAELVLSEAAIYADRIATDEETVRLRSHCSQFRKLLKEGSPIGRKLDFLIQEFNREANTIGSKCQNSEISYLVVDLKSEIEKIREQIQNIE